jgi:hypothetical protein
MNLLSSTVSVTRYLVDGVPEAPALETIREGLIKNTFMDIDVDHSEDMTGWTSFENPFLPNFKDSSFVIGTYLVFSLRLDKKSIPPKVIKKHIAVEMARRLEIKSRPFLTRDEKQAVRDHVIQTLARRIPAVPSIYDVIWNLEESRFWFFTNLKSPNEALVTLFIKSFDLGLIRLFPYTAADLDSGLSGAERDILLKLSPTKFTE